MANGSKHKKTSRICTITSLTAVNREKPKKVWGCIKLCFFPKEDER